MNKKLAAEHIDFADSEYESFHMTQDAILTIHMKSWKNEYIRVVFMHTTQFLYKLGDVPKNLYEFSVNTAFLNEALLQEYIKIPEHHPYKHYQLEDIHDFPFIQVIAESVEVFRD